MESCYKEFNMTELFCLEIFEQIFSYLDHYELAAVRLVCKTFNHAANNEFGKKSRLVVNPINMPELDDFMLSSSLQIRNVRLLNLTMTNHRIDGHQCLDENCGPFDCTNLTSLPTNINDLEVVECYVMDEKTLLQICARFDSMTTFSCINDTVVGKIDAAYIIAHLSGRIKTLTIKINQLAEYFDLPVITTSVIESLTILHRDNINAYQFRKTKLYTVLAAVSKGLNHLSLDFWLPPWGRPDKYVDDVVTVLSELEWNLQSLELLIEPFPRSTVALQKLIKKSGNILTELILHGQFFDLNYNAGVCDIFEWICDNCPQLTKLMFVCKETVPCGFCQDNDFEIDRLENLKKLTKLKAFKAPNHLDNEINEPAIIETIQQLNSHLRHLEITLDPCADDQITDLGLLGHFSYLTSLKISRGFSNDESVGEFLSQLFQNFISLQVLSLDVYESYFMNDKNSMEEICPKADVRNLKKLRSIEINSKCMCPWLTFQQLSEMPSLCSITFKHYKAEIQLSDIRKIIQNCKHLRKVRFQKCKWSVGNEAMKLQIMAAVPYGRKCSIEVI